MDQFLEKYQLPKLNLYEMNNLNSTVAIKKIEFVNLSLLKKTSLGPDGFTKEFHQTFNE